MKHSQQQRQQALEEIVTEITAETQRLQNLRERIRYFEARRDMKAHEDVAQPVSDVRVEQRLDKNDNNGINQEAPQLAMRMSSSPRRPDPFHLVGIASSLQRPDPFGRRSVLPSGPSNMNALKSAAILARLPPLTMIEVPVQNKLK
jgi:hypothetical protein